MNYNFDINELKRQVSEVIQESQGLSVSVDKIIDDWLEAKKKFIEKMNGNLIFQTQDLVTFNLDDSTRLSRLNQFADCVRFRYGNIGLSDFLYDIRTDDFYKNKTSTTYNCYISNDNDEDKKEWVKIEKNFKVIKSFKFFEQNKETLEKLQDEASQLIQENCVTGYLCFSVHPLDFLSASENTYRWRSCHALDGEYRCGNLSYLMDDCTAICYLKGEDEVILPLFPSSVPWNSKKWRTWIYFSNDESMLFFGRQYPFLSNTGITYIIQNILPQINMGVWQGPHNSRITSMTDQLSSYNFHFQPFIPVGRTLRPLEKLVVNGPDTHMYNDILRSSYLTPYAYRINHFDSRKKNALSQNTSSWTGITSEDTQFLIGKPCLCPICEENYINFNNIMACLSCAEKYDIGDSENYFICDICGISSHIDEMTTLDISGDQVCLYCLNHETVKCQICGAVDTVDYIKYYKGQYLCKHCIDYLEEE